MTVLSYEHIPIQECSEPLVLLNNFYFILEPVYYLKDLSNSPNVFLRKSVVEKLLEIQNQIQPFKLKIWDGWRSRDIQNHIYQEFWQDIEKQHPEWDKVQIEQEVSKFVTLATCCERIPPHTTGGAVDLTLVDKEGNELDMGTPFDHFGPESAAFYYEENNTLNKQVTINRKLLRDSMASSHFCIDLNEWWHFDYGNQMWAINTHQDYAIYGEIE